MNHPPREPYTELIVELIAKQLGVSAERVTRATFLVDDLSADLLALTQLALALEDELDIEIPDEEWIDVATVGEVVEYVLRLVDQKRARSDGGGTIE